MVQSISKSSQVANPWLTCVSVVCPTWQSVVGTGFDSQEIEVGVTNRKLAMLPKRNQWGMTGAVPILGP